VASSFAGPNSYRLFLWGYLKSKVYSTRPTDLHELKENIREEIAKLSEETLQAVMRSFLTRVHLCIEEGGGHLKDIIICNLSNDRSKASSKTIPPHSAI